MLMYLNTVNEIRMKYFIMVAMYECNVGDLGEIDGRIIIAESYAEAAGFIVAHKAGNL